MRYFKWAGETPGAMFPTLGVAVWRDHPQPVWDEDQAAVLATIAGVVECDKDGHLPALPVETPDIPPDAPRDAAPE